MREARLTAKVRHPNIVSVHGVDLHEGRVGLWTDFVDGKTLAALLVAQALCGAPGGADRYRTMRGLERGARGGLLH
jgi:hypothetical protein